MATKRWTPDVAEIEDVSEVVERVAAIIENRRLGMKGLSPAQLRHLAAALEAAAVGDLDRGKDALDAALS